MSKIFANTTSGQLYDQLVIQCPNYKLVENTKTKIFMMEIIYDLIMMDRGSNNLRGVISFPFNVSVIDEIIVRCIISDCLSNIGLIEMISAIFYITGITYEQHYNFSITISSIRIDNEYTQTILVSQFIPASHSIMSTVSLLGGKPYEFISNLCSGGESNLIILDQLVRSDVYNTIGKYSAKVAYVTKYVKLKFPFAPSSGFHDSKRDTPKVIEIFDELKNPGQIYRKIGLSSRYDIISILVTYMWRSYLPVYIRFGGIVPMEELLLGSIESIKHHYPEYKPMFAAYLGASKIISTQDKKIQELEQKIKKCWF
jgi:hypothetical protein